MGSTYSKHVESLHIEERVMVIAMVHAILRAHALEFAISAVIALSSAASDVISNYIVASWHGPVSASSTSTTLVWCGKISCYCFGSV